METDGRTDTEFLYRVYSLKCVQLQEETEPSTCEASPGPKRVTGSDFLEPSLLPPGSAEAGSLAEEPDQAHT